MATQTINANLDVLGEVQGTSLDINGNADISGNITSANWTGDVIGSAYLDADTAHLSTTQTFTGAKTFTGTVALTGTGRITGIDTVSADTDAASKTYVDSAVSSAGGGDVTLSGTQTFTGVKTFGTTTKLQFRDSAAYINSPTANDIEVAATTITLDASSDIQLEGNTTVTGSITADQINLQDGGDYITFYGNDAGQHSISSRDASGTAGQDDLRINSYAAVHINLDSNSNNGSNADFTIGHHGDNDGAITQLFTVDGENGNVTLTGIVLDGNTITGVDDSGEFTNDDAHIMTSAAVEDKILGYSYITASSSDTLSNKTIAASQITEISNITASEGAQLENIGSTTISATQWGYLGAATGAITNTDTNTQLSTEQVQDIVGGMLVGTETRIGVSYDDTNGRINFVVDDMTANTNTQLSNAEVRAAVAAATDSQVFTDADHTKLNGIATNATADQTNVSGSSGSCTGNAATATKISSITNSNIVQLSTTTTQTGTKTFSGVVDITNTTDSTNATGDTGALRTEGGASIAKKLYVGSTITGSADVIAFSDRKLKENIETLDGKKVLDMRGVSFTRKDTGAESSGVIAQEIQKVAPELVHDTEGTLGVAYGNLVGYLIEAVKDQQKQIDELKKLCNGCSR